MGMSAGGGKAGPKGDINVTPLVDVVLVLLIIFMVSMPIMLMHITVEIPRKLTDEEVVASSTTQITLTGNPDGSIDLDDGSGKVGVTRPELAKTLRGMVDKIKSERVVFIDFDDSWLYSDVVSIMDTIKSMGKDAAGLETNPVKVALKLRETGAGVPAQ
jgi:biopolymer transport protein TolR